MTYYKVTRIVLPEQRTSRKHGVCQGASGISETLVWWISKKVTCQPVCFEKPKESWCICVWLWTRKCLFFDPNWNVNLDENWIAVAKQRSWDHIADGSSKSIYQGSAKWKESFGFRPWSCVMCHTVTSRKLVTTIGSESSCIMHHDQNQNQKFSAMLYLVSIFVVLRRLLIDESSWTMANCYTSSV